MTEQEQFKRNIAYKLRIGDILIGKPVMNGERFGFLELGNKKIVRVNVVANVIDKYESDSPEKSYVFTTLDDGSSQIKVKAFSEDAEKIRHFNQGQTILVIGTLRYFNNELYIQPEIAREMPPEYLLVRKLEVEKDKKQNAPTITSSQDKIAIKDKILAKIKDAEKDGGIEVDKIIMEVRDASPDIINQEITKFLEEGIIFEPRPGKVRWLG